MDILYLLLLLLLSLSSRATAMFTYTQCEGTNSTTTTAAFRDNLNILLASFSSPSSTFSTETVIGSSSSDRVYGLALCQADVSLSLCDTCLKFATVSLPRQCPNYTRATIWHESCQVRYSDAPFFSSVDISSPVQLDNGFNATNPDAFIKSEKALLQGLCQQAVYNSSLMFATGIVQSSSGVPTIYGMVQCTRDLSKAGCKYCLQEIFVDWQCCSAQQGGRILAKTCSFRYELYSFFHSQPFAMLVLPSPNSSTPGDSGSPPAAQGQCRFGIQDPTHHQATRSSSEAIESNPCPIISRPEGSSEGSSGRRRSGEAGAALEAIGDELDLVGVLSFGTSHPRRNTRRLGSFF